MNKKEYKMPDGRTVGFWYDEDNLGKISDEMIAYFNRRVSEMDIAQDYKMELLGMVTALGYKHEKTAQQWIPCSERLPDEFGEYLVTKKAIGWNCEEYNSNDIAYFDNEGFHKADKVLAWMPLPEAYKGE